jgi:hypothetical protein
VILSANPKSNRCKHCKERMPAELARHVLHEDCIAPFLEVMAQKKAAARAKKERAEKRVEKARDRQRREALKTIADLIAEAQVEFNAFIRARDAGQPCICCGKPFEPDRPGGSVDAGHFRSRGSAPHLRFNEDNCFAQRKNCNRPGGTTYAAFRAGVLTRIGEERLAAVEANHEVHKWTRDELVAIKTTYRSKLKELKRTAP